MKFPFIARCGAGALLAVVLSASLPAQSQGQPEKKQHSLSEKTSEALKNLGPLQAEKKFDDMMKLVDGALTTAAPGSYDRAFLLDIKAKIYLGLDQLSPAIAPWEEAVALHAQHQYFDEKYGNELLLYLAQLIFGEAMNIKEPARQVPQINRAGAYLKRYLDAVPKPSAETQLFYAQLLYQQAAADPNKIDQGLLKQARQAIERTLMSTIQPKESVYKIYLVILQQQTDAATESADLLELMTQKFSGNKDYWTALAGTYLNLANAEKNSDRQREYFIRTINTIERAQALGFMKEPKDNYMLFSIYSMVGQISRASDILHSGLKSGGIESTLANWRYLGSYYQQSNKELQAIEALKEAVKLFPKEGMLDFQIGEIYRGLEKTREAREAYKTALAKGNLEKPLVVWQLLSYASLELDDLDEAKRAIDEAAKLPDFQREQQAKSLRDHINLMIEERKIREEDAAKKKA